MYPYLKIFGFDIPTYSIMIILGIVFANIIGLYCAKQDKKIDINDLSICEAYTGLGAIIGSKLLYLWVTRSEIDWSRIIDINYFNGLMKGGFVFYGGLIGGFIFFIIGCRLHKIDAFYYLNKFIFLIPFIHTFGRIGCFMAGCCYGIRYEGIFAVAFSENSFAPANVNLFPVQLLEAIILLAISFILFICQKRKKESIMLPLYFIMYGVSRFLIEFLRYDEIRGKWLYFSTSQWISAVLIVIAFVILIYSKKRNANCSIRD
ncbi:MAG: prolipoprotein diacylglyceryl transferase [Clostridia bacterium]|nr:prolipoprotein diacylglyceryl transferase [Clostridia bacterium]